MPGKTKGGSAQDRRRDRRAAARATDAQTAIAATLALGELPPAPDRASVALALIDAALPPAIPEVVLEQQSDFFDLIADRGNAARGSLRVVVPESSRAAVNLGLVSFTLTDIVFADASPLLDVAAGERLPAPNPSPAAPEPAPTAASGALAWEAVFVPEGTLTDDGRAFAPGALTWRELPLTLMAMIETSEGGHVGAQVSGRIDRIWRDENSVIRAAGVFDDGDYGQEIARMVADGTLSGLSVDTAIHEYDIAPRSDYFDEDGRWLTEKPEAAEADGEEPSLVEMLFGEDVEDPVFVVTKAVIGMATVCPFPAFASASISLAASGAIWRHAHQAGFIVVRTPLVASAALEEAPAATSLTAAAAGLAPLKPPAVWFDDPALDGLTPLTVDEDGRVFGHAWAWETCHIAFPDSCVTAPHTETQNAYFHVGELECADGERIPVGKVTIDTGHAGQRLTRAESAAHYDHTGAVAAHVCCGEDEYGGWVAGAIHPELSEEKLRLLRGAALSGDWRNVNGNLELVALLAVNVPGFPIPRTRALVAAGDDGDRVLALTAAGAFASVEDVPPDEDAALAEVAAIAATAR